MFHGARILVAPLDWGLGHAARCVPIVQALMQQGAVPVIAADRGPLALLQKEFPELEHVRLPGTPVHYSSGNKQLLTLALQFPRMLRSIEEEHRATETLVAVSRIDAIISDQRFGVRCDRIPSVLITHQLFPRVPLFRSQFQSLNRRCIEKFDACWVMDAADPPGLAGSLSHGADPPKNVRYIGIHSRFGKTSLNVEKHFTVVAVLSGPEPQRTLFEKKVTEQLRRIDGEHLVVQGLMNGGDKRHGRVTTVPSLPAVQLEEAMRSAKLVVARSGYTTLMDLAVIDARAVLIPTPGQPEQEYLAGIHADTGRYLVRTQQTMDLTEAMALAPVPQERTDPDPLPLREAMEELALSIKTMTSLSST